MTPLVLAPSPLAVVVSEECVVSGNVCEDSLLVVPLGEADFVRFGDDVVFVVDTNVCVVEFDFSGPGVVKFLGSMLSSLLQRLDRRQRTVT